MGSNNVHNQYRLNSCVVMAMSLVQVLNQVFEVLFFGSGMWLGLLLFIILAISLVQKLKEAGILIMPIIIWMGIEYATRINNDPQKFIWPVIILFLIASFIIYKLVK